MKRRVCPLALALLATACSGPGPEQSPDHRASAERYFQGVYGCDLDAIDDTASDDVVVSYPVFQSIFGQPTIRGRSAVKEFAAGFCSRWSDSRFTVHEAVQDGNRLVLVWEFEATGAVPDSAGTSAPPERRSWGGISFLRFDADGRVVEELGEESTPGPMARLRGPS